MFESKCLRTVTKEDEGTDVPNEDGWTDPC